MSKFAFPPPALGLANLGEGISAQVVASYYMRVSDPAAAGESPLK
jgi:hypothetical protein